MSLEISYTGTSGELGSETGGHGILKGENGGGQRKAGKTLVGAFADAAEGVSEEGGIVELVRRSSMDNDSHVSHGSDASGMTGQTTTTATGLTQPTSMLSNTVEGRAIKKYLKQPLPMRATVEAWEIDPSEICVLERMGEGQVGIIHKARWRGLDVALKTLKDGVDFESDEHKDLQNELEILTRNRHPNLVMFLGACTNSEPFMIVCEYMPGGSIESLFISKRRAQGGQPWRPPRQQVVAWSSDLVRALCFLHGCTPKIVHRDLKPSNLLLSSNSTLKVSDFGLSRTIRRRRTVKDLMQAGLSGTKRYMAPELFNENGKYNEKVDIYAAAMIMWYIYMGEQPFNDAEADQAAKEAAEGRSALRPPLEGIQWRPFADIVQRAWHASPKERPNVNEVMTMLDTLTETEQPSCKCCVS